MRCPRLRRADRPHRKTTHQGSDIAARWPTNLPCLPIGEPPSAPQTESIFHGPSHLTSTYAPCCVVSAHAFFARAPALARPARCRGSLARLAVRWQMETNPPRRRGATDRPHHARDPWCATHPPSELQTHRAAIFSMHLTHPADMYGGAPKALYQVHRRKM